MNAMEPGSGGTGFPAVPGYVITERCDEDGAGAWFRGQSLDGDPVRVRILTAPPDPRPAPPEVGGARAPKPRAVADLPGGGVAFVQDDPGLVSLADVLAHGGLLTPGQIVGLCLGVRDALAGLAGAHGAIGLTTVLLDRGGNVWVGDVGVAAARGRRVDRHTDSAGLARAALLALAGQGPDAAPTDASMAEDPATAMRRVLVEATGDTPATVGVPALADALRPYAAPAPLVVPAHLLPSRPLDLAARMRALAHESREEIDLADGRLRATLSWPGRGSGRRRAERHNGAGPGGGSARPRDEPPNGAASAGHRSSGALAAPGTGRPSRARAAGLASGPRDPRATGRTGPVLRPARGGSRRTPREILDRLRGDGLTTGQRLLVAGAGMLGCLAVAILVLVSGGSGADRAPGGNHGDVTAADAPTASSSRGGSPTSRVPPPPVPSSSSGPAPTDATPQGTSEPVAAVFDPTSPARRAEGLAQDLADLRSRAWADLDLDAIGRLDVDGSPAASADRAALTEARAKGLRYDGLEFVVSSASARDLETGPGEEASLVALEVRLDVSAYAIRTPGGVDTHVARLPDQRIRLVVAWSGQRWQITRVDSA